MLKNKVSTLYEVNTDIYFEGPKFPNYREKKGPYIHIITLLQYMNIIGWNV